jgi:type IV pilus assembly protein PilM
MPVFSRKTVILDLGASRTALGVFSQSSDRLRLDDFEVEAFSGQTGAETDWLEQTRAALAVLRTRTKIGGPVVLVLPPHLTLTKLIRTPRVEPSKRAKILRFEAEQSLPYAPTEVVWGTVVAAEHETEIEMLLAAAKLEALEALCGVVQTAGFEPHLVLPSSLATLAAFRLAQGTAMEPTLMLSLGARSTTLLQVTGQRFAVRSLAQGTRNIMWQTAEQQDHVALGIIATRLAQEITRSMLHFRRQGGREPLARICLAGGGARLSGLGEALAVKLKVPVSQLDLSGSIELGRSVAPDDAVGHPLTLADLVGAAATQLLPGQPVMNLLPRSLRQQANRRRRLWLAAAFLITAAALSPLAYYLRPEAGSARVGAVIRPEAAPRQVEASAPPPAVRHPAEADESFDLELVDVKTTPFPLQLAGYLGDPGGYLVAFTSADQPETLLARRGHRFASLGLTLRSFEVRKVAVDHGDAWPVYEVAGFAVLHDENTGTEVVLDSRRKPTGTLQAVLRGSAGHQPSALREGELLAQGGATYRIQRIQADPPEVVVVRQAGGLSAAETRVLQPVRPAGDPGEQPVAPDTAAVPNGL